jgi:hypothetical protein
MTQRFWLALTATAALAFTVVPLRLSLPGAGAGKSKLDDTGFDREAY